jgi:hypothetical protein
MFIFAPLDAAHQNRFSASQTKLVSKILEQRAVSSQQYRKVLYSLSWHVNRNFPLLDFQVGEEVTFNH